MENLQIAEKRGVKLMNSLSGAEKMCIRDSVHTIQNCTELLQCTILDIDKGAVFHTVILLIHTIRGKDLLQLINREIVGCLLYTSRCV